MNELLIKAGKALQIASHTNFHTPEERAEELLEQAREAMRNKDYRLAFDLALHAIEICAGKHSQQYKDAEE